MQQEVEEVVEFQLLPFTLTNIQQLHIMGAVTITTMPVALIILLPTAIKPLDIIILDVLISWQITDQIPLTPKISRRQVCKMQFRS